MIKVGLFNESFFPQLDGVAVTVENYARIIDKKYGESYVVVPNNKKRTCDEFPYTVWEYPSSKINVVDQYSIGIPISSTLRRKLLETPMDIIHSHCPFTSGVFAQRIVTRKDIPHITTFHSKYKDDVNQRLKVKMDMPGELVAKYIVAFYKRCDYVWAVSQGTADTLSEYGFKGKITVMPNGCDMPASYRDDETRKHLLQKYSFKEDSPLLLFVGRHTWTKNLKILIKSLGALARNGVKFNMLFVGGGEDKPAMEEMVNEQGISSMVRFAGKIMERDVLQNIYTSSDLFLFPSIYDNAPLVVREAAACGCASVLIKGSNSAEGAVHALNAFLTKDTVEDFALTVKTALDSNRLNEVGSFARRDMYISWDDVLLKVVEEYEKIKGEWVSKEAARKIARDEKVTLSNIDMLKEYNLLEKAKLKKKHDKQVLKEKKQMDKNKD
jgi:1,2-diacylglycerol 3-alpha-glucosyltransferase